MSNRMTRSWSAAGTTGWSSAAYLARSGARTVVLESRGTVGGAATTEAPWPDAPAPAR